MRLMRSVIMYSAYCVRKCSQERVIFSTSRSSQHHGHCHGRGRRGRRHQTTLTVNTQRTNDNNNSRNNPTTINYQLIRCCVKNKKQMTIVVRPKKASSSSSPSSSPTTTATTTSSRNRSRNKSETKTSSHRQRRRKDQRQQQQEDEEEDRNRTSSNNTVISTMPVSPRPKRSSVNPQLSSSTSSAATTSLSMPSVSTAATTTNNKKQPISLPSQLKPMSISTTNSAHRSSFASSTSTTTSSNKNNNNPSSSSSSMMKQQCSPRIKKFQICMWVTLVLAFIHLISKPPSIDVTSPEDHGKEIKTTKTKTATTKTKDNKETASNNDKHGHNKNNKSTDITATDDTDSTTSNDNAKITPTPAPVPPPTSKLKRPTDEQPQSKSQSQSQSKPTTPAPVSAPNKSSSFEKTKETKNTKSSSTPTPTSTKAKSPSSSSSSSTTTEKTTKTTKTTKKDKKHTPPSPTLSPPPETNSSSSSSSSTTETTENDDEDDKDDKDNSNSSNEDNTDRDKSKKGDDDGDIITTTQPTTTTTTTTKESYAPSPSPLQPPKFLDPSSFSVLPPKTSTDISDTSRQFVEKHCDMNGFNIPASSSATATDAAGTATSWYPSQDENIWQQRAPYFIVAGVWNSGINDLTRTLLKYHPQIIPSKIPGFFLPRQFKHYYKLVPSTSSKVDNGSGGGSSSIVESSSSSSSTTSTEVSNVKVFAARNKMYASVYSRSALRDNNDNSSSSSSNNNNKNNTLVAMDVSPGLIFYAHTTAHSILCVAPWSKIVVLLRNPIDRVYKQWLYSKTNLGLTLSLEDWMAQEMQLMHDVGLIDAVSYGMKATEAGQHRMTAAADGGDTDNDNGEKTVVVPEREAWNKYQAVRGMPKSIGRSLYVLQLEEWINTFKEAGMNPSEEMIVLLSEEVEEHPQEQYTKLFQFLGLGPVGITSPVRTPAPATADPIRPETREMLETFFRPYNRRLEKLLKDNGFEGNWEKLWK